MAKKITFVVVFTVQSVANYMFLNKLFFSRRWVSFILEEREKKENQLSSLMLGHEGILSLIHRYKDAHSSCASL